MELLDAYENEDNYVVWLSICNNLEKLRQLLAHTENIEALQQFCIRLFDKIYTKIGWKKHESDSHLDMLLRPLIISNLIKYGCKKTCAEAKAR